VPACLWPVVWLAVAKWVAKFELCAPIGHLKPSVASEASVAFAFSFAFSSSFACSWPFLRVWLEVAVCLPSLSPQFVCSVCLWARLISAPAGSSVALVFRASTAHCVHCA